MRKLSLVIHASLKQEMSDYLRSIQIEQFMFSHIEEHGLQNEHDPLLSAHDKVVGYVPKVRIDIILRTEESEYVLNKIKTAPFSLKGKGFYWLSNLYDSGVL